jgi:hypothetical protein
MHDVEEETWGQKTIRFYDIGNKLIEIGETIPCFIKRMHQDGLSAEKIVNKSSVPQELVLEYIQ